MDIEMLNPHVMKILISARDVDSINSISHRIGLSYGWTHYWAKRLIDVGVFEGSRTKLSLNRRNPFYYRVLNFIHDSFKEDASFHYSILSLFGIKYCFTKTDAVFVWTNGGYNIARFREYYPIFIKVAEEDRDLFGYYCRKLNLRVSQKRGIFYSVEFVKDINPARHNNVPVDSLDDTIHFMMENKYNFEPALEMIQNLYKKRLGVRYQEAIVNV